MPQEVISFEEAVSTEPVSPTGEISFADAIGQPTAQPKPDKPLINFSNDPAEITRRYGFQPGELDDKPDDPFPTQIGKTIMRGIVAATSRPRETTYGAGKAVVSGLVSLGESAVAGWRGLLQGGGTVEGTTAKINETMEQAQQLRSLASQVTKINLAPENEQEKAMEDLLMLIPEGINKVGDTVYEKTGNALFAAGTQALTTLLTLKPSIAGKVIEGVPPETVTKAMEGLAKQDMPAAQAIVTHIEQTAPATAKKLKVKLKPLAQKAAKAGEDAVRDSLPTEITPEQAGIGLADAAAEVGRAAENSPVKGAKPAEVIDATPPPKKGFMRFYHGGSPEGVKGSLWFTTSLPDAQGWAARGEGMKIWYVDVPEGIKEVDWGDLENGMPMPSRQELPPNIAGKRQVLRGESELPGLLHRQAGDAEHVAATAAADARAQQVFVAGSTLDALPGGEFVKGKLSAWYDEIIRTINPEALGDKAKQAAAVLASKIAETMNKDATNHGFARERRLFWDRLSPKAIQDFMREFEEGKPHKDPTMQKVAEYLRQRNREIFEQDQRTGIKYDPIDNYLYHAFENGQKLADYFQAKYGAKWGDPGFTKDRTFQLYDEAIAAGFKPKFINPEEIMLARQHASDIAQMKAELLAELEQYGLAKKITKADKDQPKGSPSNYRRSPTGDGYWIDAQADAVLYNAFDTKSLWNMPGIRGDVFRGAMFLKNAIVPIKLALSLFHPLHVATIDNATGMVRATKSLLSGQVNPVKWLGQMLDSTLYGSKGVPFKGVWDNPKLGYRLLRAYQGKISAEKLTSADKLALQYMAEGGMIPEMPMQYKANAIEKFGKAVRQVAAEYNQKNIKGAVEQGGKAGFHLAFAALEALQAPMFRVWIPSLKVASYLKDVQTAIKANPELVVNRAQRLLAFRKLAKSVDNRYGEMAYNTLFWNRMIKDIAVANTLSLGWNLGFIREYGGGAIDLGRAIGDKGSLATKAKAGLLDRPLFVAFYTTQALLYGGLLTWALTGQSPTSLMDYIYPKSGNKDAQGKDERLNTMFYPREFASIAKHVEHEGVATGMWHVISNKASGVVGLVKQWATGVNWQDQEIRDPNSPIHQQVKDTLAATLTDLEPISVRAVREGPKSAKDILLNISGFNKAPKYVTQSDTEAKVSTLYRKYYAQKQTAYEAALLSNDRRKLAQYYEKEDFDNYDKLLDKMVEQYDLTASEQQKLNLNILRRGVEYNPYLTMFERLTWQQQKRLLDKMSEDERAEYLPHANREHLRFSYEEPEEEPSRGAR